MADSDVYREVNRWTARPYLRGCGRCGSDSISHLATVRVESQIDGKARALSRGVCAECADAIAEDLGPRLYELVHK